MQTDSPGIFSWLKIRILKIGSEQLKKKSFTEEWINAVNPFGTNQIKQFLSTPHYLIAIFAEKYALSEKGRVKNYYMTQSVGITSGFF